MLNKDSKPYYYETYHHSIFWNKKDKKGYGVLFRVARRKKKKNLENKLFGQQAMIHDAILKQVWENYPIIAFINNQFLTSIYLSTGFIRSKDTARQRLA